MIIMYYIELTPPNGRKIYYSTHIGFHLRKNLADVFEKKDQSRTKLDEMKENLSKMWELNRKWRHWGGCKQEEVAIQVIEY